MRRRSCLVAVATILVACSSPKDEGGDPGGDRGRGLVGDLPSSTDPGTGPKSEDPRHGGQLAKGVVIRNVAIFQGVKVPLVKNAARVPTRNAPVVAGRDALIRAYVDVPPELRKRRLSAELKLTSGESIIDSKVISRVSIDEDMSTTFNFEVSGGTITPDTRFSIAVHDPSDLVPRYEMENPARWPHAGGMEALEADSRASGLKIVLVPVRYDADGSGRLPEMSPTQIERYRSAFYAMYPTAAVDISLRKALPWSEPQQHGGGGWSKLLQSIIALRQQDHASPDHYYYGIVAPTESLPHFCLGGCVMGMSSVVEDPTDAVGRASVGLGFSGDQAAMTAVHEIGHAHGRPHAPCGNPSGEDPSYPYDGARIGVWGWDLLTKRLVGPATGRDFMSYCTPEWISDYTYLALFERMVVVKGSPPSEGMPRPYRFVQVGDDGAMTWGDRVYLHDPPRNSPRSVSYLDASGNTLATATGHFYPSAEGAGGILLVPDQLSNFEKLRVPSFKVPELARRY